MNCPQCNRELNFPEDALKKFTNCPFCGGPLQVENEEKSSTPIETVLKNITDEFGGVEIFADENSSRLHKALITIDNEFANDRDRLILANMRNIPQKLYNVINASKTEQQIIADECQQNLLSFGLQENIASDIISWFANTLKITLEKNCKILMKKMGTFDYNVDGYEYQSGQEIKCCYQYKTCIIGDREWFAENFKNDYGKFFSYLPKMKCIGECCSNEKYGKLYTFSEATANAPEGWRLPTVKDFVELADYINNLEYDSGTALKSTNQWRGHADAGLDLFGFCAYPTVRDYKTGEAQTWFWTSSETGDKDYPYYCVSLTANSNELSISSKAVGKHRASVRFVKNAD